MGGHISCEEENVHEKEDGAHQEWDHQFGDRITRPNSPPSDIHLADTNLTPVVHDELETSSLLSARLISHRADPTPFFIQPADSDLNIPRIHGDLSLKWEDFPTWTAQQRIAAIHRWVLYAEHKYRSPLSSWPQAFDASHEHFSNGDSNGLTQWLTGVCSQIYAGRRALDYLGRVMEGELPDGTTGVRDLYVQAHRLSSTIQEAIVGLQYRLQLVQATS